MGEKEEKIDKHDSIISTPLQIFLSKPYNITFTEKRIDDVFATPKDPFSEVYTFTRPGNNVGLLKTTEASITCTMSVRSPSKRNSSQRVKLQFPLFLCEHYSNQKN